MLLALAEQQGIRSDVIPQIATPFCGGLSHNGGLCGAVSGALMGLGLRLGRRTPGESQAQMRAVVSSFLQSFQAQFGSLDCPELTACDLGTPEGQAKFHAENRIQGCNQFVAEAARLAAALIEQSHHPSETL